MDTPLTIPNRAVKHRCSDGTRKGRVASRQIKEFYSRFLFINPFCFFRVVLCYYLIMTTWARRRQLSYLAGVVVFLIALGLILFFIYKPKPSCFDGIQNQGETGIDCGGPCALACSSTVLPLKIYWTRPLKVSDGWYDVVALVENENINLGVRRASYYIYLYDENNLLLSRQAGETFINPAEKFVVFVSRLNTGQSIVGQAFLEFDKNLIWEKSKPVPKLINVEQDSFINEPRPRLQIGLTNLTLDPIFNIRVSTILSDNNNNALAASATFIDKLRAQEKKILSLTWPIPLPIEPSFFELFWRLNSFDLEK